mgnify:CR=1 FL=1
MLFSAQVFLCVFVSFIAMEKKYTADNIQSLLPHEHVRLRPQLYFKTCFDQGHLNDLPFEALCHAMDEYFSSACSQIEIALYAQGFSILYDANMSLEKDVEGNTRMENILTKIYACRNEKKHLEVGAEFCKLGLATLIFASKKALVQSASKSNKLTLQFKNGQVEKRQFENVTNAHPYTLIYLEIDAQLMPNLGYDFSAIQERAKALNEKLGTTLVQTKNCSSEDFKYAF